jgi:RNA polymerase sigma-70 factor (ECF subfamily)
MHKLRSVPKSVEPLSESPETKGSGSAVEREAPPAGDWEVQSLLLEKARPKMLGILRHHRIPPEDAEDILQDVYLLLVYKWETLHSPENWLIGATKNRCIMYWRRRRRTQSRTAEVETLDIFSEAPPQETADLHLDINRAFSRLPERCRTVLRLRYGLGYEPKEVADRLGYSRLSIGKVTNRCFKALLVAILEEQDAKSKDDPAAAVATKTDEGEELFSLGK